jgi:hypothetical protein
LKAAVKAARPAELEPFLYGSVLGLLGRAGSRPGAEKLCAALKAAGCYCDVWRN